MRAPVREGCSTPWEGARRELGGAELPEAELGGAELGGAELGGAELGGAGFTVSHPELAGDVRAAEAATLLAPDDEADAPPPAWAAR